MNTESYTTHDLSQMLGVTITTIHNWIHNGLLPAEGNVPECQRPKRSIGRWHIPHTALEALESDAVRMAPALRKYVPMERSRQRRREKVNKHQVPLPGLGEV